MYQIKNPQQRMLWVFNFLKNVCYLKNNFVYLQQDIYNFDKKW